MEYLLIFLEGISTIISPCMLPMIPIYISYLGGIDKRKIKMSALKFILGFCLIFILFSILVSIFSVVVYKLTTYFKIIFGIINIVIGLDFLSIIKIRKINFKAAEFKIKNISPFIYGIMFSLSWTPCLSTFLSSALLLIASYHNIIKGIILIIIYSIGISSPLYIFAIFTEKFKNTLLKLAKNINIINKISGIILIFAGLYIIF